MQKAIFVAAMAFASTAALANKPGDIPVPPGYGRADMTWVHIGETAAMSYYYAVVPPRHAVFPPRSSPLSVVLLTGTKSVSGGYAQVDAALLALHCNRANLPDEARLMGGITMGSEGYPIAQDPPGEMEEVPISPGTVLAKATIAACAASNGSAKNIVVRLPDEKHLGLVPDTYMPPPEPFPGAFIPKIAVQDACSVEGAFAKHEAMVLASGASLASEISRVRSYYSKNPYDQALFEVLASKIVFLSRHPKMTPAQAETAASKGCFDRSRNPRYYANLRPPAKSSPSN